MRISVWSSDVGSSDLRGVLHLREGGVLRRRLHLFSGVSHPALAVRGAWALQAREVGVPAVPRRDALSVLPRRGAGLLHHLRSEEHTSELQSLMRISYAVFCLKKKNRITNIHTTK